MRLLAFLLLATAACAQTTFPAWVFQKKTSASSASVPVVISGQNNKVFGLDGSGNLALLTNGSAVPDADYGDIVVSAGAWGIDGAVKSTGGNGAADSGKIVTYDGGGRLASSTRIRIARPSTFQPGELHLQWPSGGWAKFVPSGDSDLDSTLTILHSGGAGDGGGLTNLNASNLTTGTVPTDRLGGGTANSTTFLRGDNTWASVAASPAGAGSEIQYRSGASTFGAVTGSSTANGGITLAPSSGSALTLTGVANAATASLSSSMTGAGATRSMLTISDNWTAATGGTGVPRLLSLEVTHTGGSVNWSSTGIFRVVVNSSELLRVDHNASFSWATEGTYVDCDANKFQLGSAWGLNFAGDAWLYRDAANVMAHRNGTNAQAVRVYETDSGNNDEYVEISAASGTNYIKPAATGTGTASKLDHYVTSSVFITSGAGSPEAAVTAPVGSLFIRTDGGASTTLYVKESGSGNTGWVAK